MKHPLYLLPIIVFVVMAGFFAWRLVLIEHGNTPEAIPSAMIGKQVPQFNLPSLTKDNARVQTADVKGNVVLINFFSSWCVPCQAEHSLLRDIEDAKGIVLIGINYKDKPEDARSWLAKTGNPYHAIGSDLDGQAGIDFGVYGVPETYLLDKQGIIRFKQTGPLTPEIIQKQLLPLAKELNQ